MLWHQFTVFWSNYIAPVLQWSGWGLLIALIWYIFNHGEQVDKWITRIERFLLWLGLKRDKKYVARDIRGRINSASKKINKEADGIVTKSIEIVWVDQDNIESFLKAGRVVIMMRHHNNQDKNINNAVIHYVQTGVLNMGKIYLPEKIQMALNLSISKKILSEETENSTALDYFSLNTLEPSLKGDKELESRFSTLELMEEKGLFTRILLREIRFIGKKLYPRRPTQEILEETKRFFTFLEPFANHKSGEDDILGWQFINNNIRVGVLYVAKKSTIDVKGLEPYKKQLERRVGEGCKRIYIFGRRDNNIVAIKALVKSAQKNISTAKAHFEYYLESRGARVKAVCAILSVE